MSAGLVIGIDIGTSGTGVAWGRTGVKEANFLRWDDVQDIVKTPTRVFYRGDHPVGWALLTPDSLADDISVKEWFKCDVGTNSDPRQYYVQFLSYLYRELSTRYKPEMLGDTPWEDARIHFLFSVPATWDPALGKVFGGFASEAGFGRISGHSLNVDITEPEAVAAFQLCYPKALHRFQDFCLLEIEQGQDGHPCAIELKPVSGIDIGSTYIDAGFEAHVKKALEPLQSCLSREASHIAWEMRNSALFQNAKHDFGRDKISNEILLPLADCAGLTTGPIRDGSFVFTGREMQQLFDRQVKLLQEKMTRLANDLVELKPEPHLDCILLSGGLGSSSYVADAIKDLCANFAHPLLNSAKVIISDDPRLSVCRGMVYHALRGANLFPKFPCRASFGVACLVPKGRSVEEKWKPIMKQAKKEHCLEKIDSVTKKELVCCIDWFLKKVMWNDFKATLPLLTPAQGTMIDNGQTIDCKHSAYFAANMDRKARVAGVEIMTSLQEDPFPLRRAPRSQAPALPAPTTPNDKSRTFASMHVDLSSIQDFDIERPSGVKRTLNKAMETMGIREPFVKVNFLIEAKIGLAHAHFQCFDVSKTKALGEPISVSTRPENRGLVLFSTGLVDVDE
ncbi:hypothetical protein ACHAPT_012852 [Fusarium lateritium]